MVLSCAEPGWMVAALALPASALALLLRWRATIGSDEGYLWYGTLRVLEGRVPVRDFRAYEPGRYLWCALWLKLVGHGILGIRLGVHAFQGLALGVSLLLLGRAGVDPFVLAGVLVLVIGCGAPQHKLFEPSLALLFIASAAHALAWYSPASVLGVGLVVGLAVTFGSNLALYTGSATVLLVAHSAWSGRGEAGLLLSLVLGTMLGAAPLVAYALIAKGFLRAVFHWRIRRVWARGSSNLPLPVPWPWRRPGQPLAQQPRWRQLAVGAGFVALLAIPILGVGVVLIGGMQVLGPVGPALMSAVALSCAVWHHGFSRADPPHLAQSCLPAAATVMVATQLIGAAWLAPMLALAAGLVLWPWFGRPARGTRSRSVDAGGWRIGMSPVQARLLERVRALLAVDPRAATHPAPLLAVPNLVWILPMLGLRSPVFDTFCVYAADGNEQDAMVEELNRTQPCLAAVWLGSMDAMPDRAFAHTHPRVLAWLREYGQVIPGEEGEASLLLLSLDVPARP